MNLVIQNLIRKLHIGIGSKADMCSALWHVRFTPNSDRKSGPPHKVMSALPAKADMCGATSDVCFGPKADIASHFSQSQTLDQPYPTGAEAIVVGL